MGEAMEIKEALHEGHKRNWILDAKTGELRPKPDPIQHAATRTEPEPIQIAPQTWD